MVVGGAIHKPTHSDTTQTATSQLRFVPLPAIVWTPDPSGHARKGLESRLYQQERIRTGG